MFYQKQVPATSGSRSTEPMPRSNPVKAPPFSFPAHIHEVINGTSMTFPDAVKNSDWGDRPL